MNLVSTKWELCLLPCAGGVVLLLETDVSGRKVHRRVLAADIDAELGLTTCVCDRIGQPRAELHRGLI